MSRAIVDEREQGWLLPAFLGDQIPPDHPIRFIDSFVDALDLAGLGFVAAYESTAMGRPHYPSVLLLKVWLYGFYLGVRTTRRLEAACVDLPALQWLTGRQAPDHNTLWRFWERQGAQIPGLLHECVRVAIGLQAIGFAVHALDGTKLRAAVAKRTAWTVRDHTQLLATLDAEAAARATAITAAGPHELAARLPAALLDPADRRAQIAAQLAQLQASGRTHQFPGDPDATFMKLADGVVAPAYNAQAVVDVDSGLVVAADVTTSPHDGGALVPMLEQVAATCGQVAAVTVADGGYHTAAGLAHAVAAGFPVLLARGPHEPREPIPPFHPHAFRYDAETDTYRCPAEQLLTFRGLTRAHHPAGTTVRVYRGIACQGCPLKAACAPQRGPRRLERVDGTEAVQANRLARGTPTGQHLLRERQTSIERLFADLKHHRNFRRFVHRTLAKVRVQWLMECLVHNLRLLQKAHLHLAYP